jgi:hypothetical protein
MTGMQLGRRFGAALAVFAAPLALTPGSSSARAATVLLSPADRSGAIVPGEDAVASALVRFPAGQLSPASPIGTLWSGRRPRGAPEPCIPRTDAFGLAAATPIGIAARDFKRGTMRRSRATVTLTGAGLAAPRRLGAERVAGRAKALGSFIGFLHARLPDDVLPAYPRREIYVGAVDYSGVEQSELCPAAVERRAEAAARVVLRGARIELPPVYTPPPAPQPPPTLDLLSGGGLHLSGAHRGDDTGADVAAAGDVNGDGLSDAVVSAATADRPGKRDAGAAFVVFGRSGGGVVPLSRLGPGGFRIDGPVARESSFQAVGVGDLDGDGLAEIAVGAPEAGRGHNGVVYVVRGKRDGAAVDLARRDDVLFAIRGGHGCAAGLGGGQNIGARVAAIGDANGDGIGDIGVLWPDNCGDGRTTGAVYIVFGKRSAGDVDLNRLGAGGITVRAESDAEFSDVQIAGAGDTNGDGLADLILGGAGYDESPYAALVQGRRTGGAVRVSRLATKFTSALCADVGTAVAGPGDVNGDGFADVAIGAPESCIDAGGRAFVVFGGPDPGRINLDQLGTHGFQIVSSADFRAGRSLGAPGDVNGDGLADLALGDEDYSPAGRRFAGAVVVVHGQRGTEPIRLRSLGEGGFRWLGTEHAGGLGRSVAGVGDFDGDGRPDLLAGAPLGASTAGGAWILPQS